jgi:hypothetical protein
MRLHASTEAKLARAGMVLLALSPFSLISSTMLSLLALGSLLLPLHAYNTASLDLPGPKRLLVTMGLVYALSFIGAGLSLAELLYQGRAGLGAIAARFGGQQIALLLGFFHILCGFFMAQRCSDAQLRRLIMIPALVIIAVAAYQLVSLATGLPFIGKLVDDRFVGLRPSSLAVEPKYLASYLACLIFYLGFRLRETPLAPRVLVGLLLCSCLYFFIAAASANGAMIFVLLIGLLLLVLPARWRWSLIVLALIGVQTILLQIDAESLGLRETHKDLISNLDAVDLTLLDDLIALPVMAWMDNPAKVFTGFGPGLMHFFAADFGRYATWWEGDTYIEGNVSFLMYASNFGLLLYLLLLVGICSAAVARARRPAPATSMSTVFFFASSFIAGAVVTGNISVPFFVAIGWLFGTPRAAPPARAARSGPRTIESIDP